MSRLWPLATAFIVLAIPNVAMGCEPIWPLAQLLAGSTAAGPIYLTQSVFWLVAGIALKCLAFARFEKRLSPSDAKWGMLKANLVSTIPGVVVAGTAASSPIGGSLFALPVVCLLAVMIQRRANRLPKEGVEAGLVSGTNIVIAFILFSVVSTFLYGFAMMNLDEKNYASYWVLKLGFVSVVAISGIVVSAILEESVIANLHQKTHGSASFYTSVIRANYVTLAAILFVASVQIIPERLKARGFVVSVEAR